MILKRIVLFSRGAFYRFFFLGGRKVMPKRIVLFSRGLFYRIFFLDGREVIVKRTILFSTPFLDRIVFFSSPGRCPEEEGIFFWSWGQSMA